MIELDDFLMDPEIQATTKPVGIVDGPYGVWLLEYYKFLNGTSDIIYDRLRNKMNCMTRLFNESTDYTISLGYGLSGFLWTMKCIVQDPGIYSKIVLKDALVPYIEKECLSMIHNQDFDLFTGAHGVMMYLVSIDSLTPRVYASYINELEDYLTEHEFFSRSLEAGTYDKKWRVDQTVIVHRLPGIVLMLSRLYQCKPTTKCRKLIQRIVAVVTDGGWTGKVQSNRVTPFGEVDIDGATVSENYTQLVLGYALVKAGVVLNNPGFEDKGLQVLESIHDQQEYEIENLSICYGAPFRTYVYHKLWQITGLEKFQSVRNEWVDRVHQLWYDSDKVRVHNNVRRDPMTISSLTHGFAGPRLVLLTVQGKIGHHWDEWMLL